MFSRHGGSMGEMGCVAWMFNRRGYCTIEDTKFTEDDVMNVVLDAGAEDVKSDGTVIEVTCAVADFDKVTTALTAAKIPYTNAKITMIPQNTVVMEENKVKQMLELMDDLEEHEDVQNTFANFDIPEAILQKFM